MSQSQKTLLMLLAVVALGGALGGYAYFGVYQRDAKVAKKTEHELRLFAPQKFEEKTPDGGAPPAEFTKLSLTFEGQTTVLEREPGQPWWVVSPVHAKADRLVVDAILSILQTSRFKATLDEDPDAATLAKYGLTKPTFVVEATATVNGEQRSVKLVGGIENTFDGSIFVRRNDEKPVFTAEGGVRFTMAKTTYDLRDKAPLAVEEAKIKTLAVKTKHNAYTLEHVDKLWNLTQPAAEPADTQTVSGMISQVSGEKAQAFLDDTKLSPAAMGLDDPMVQATITTTDGKTVKLTIGRVATDGGEVFYGLRQDDDGTVLAQFGNGASEYDRNPADLRDKTLLRFKKELVTKMVFHDTNGTEVVVAKDSVDASAESWRVVAPKAGKAKIFKVTSALWTLSNTRALTTGEDKPKDWKKYGIDEKSKFIALYGEDGKELARLTVGNLVPNTPTAYFVRGTRDQVLQSDGSRFGELPFALADVLDEPVVDAGVTSP